jgi:hypothetical protein
MMAAQAPEIPKEMRTVNPTTKEGLDFHAFSENLFGRVDTPPYEQVKSVDLPLTMYVHAIDYVEYVNSLGLKPRWIERELDCSSTFPGMKGYADVCGYDGDHDLHIVDAKYGYRFVEVEDNPQLLIYVAAILALKEGLNPKRIHLHIYQPRSISGGESPASTHVYETLEEFHVAHQRVTNAAHATCGDELTCVAGEHCRYCKGNKNCPTLNESVDSIIEFVRAYEHPVDITLESAAATLALITGMAGQLKALKAGLEEFVTFKLRNGETCAEYTHSQTLTNRAWTWEPEDVIEIGRQFGANLAVQGLVSPAQAEKLGLPKEVVASMVERHSKGFKLKRATLRDAKKAFGGKK